MMSLQYFFAGYQRGSGRVQKPVLHVADYQQRVRYSGYDPRRRQQPGRGPARGWISQRVSGFNQRFVT